VNRVFLTADWLRLAIVTFAVPDEALAPHLPPGTEPDRWQGSALASLVAFEFERTRVMGVAALGFRTFPEWNLRFYVRAPGTGGVRRGVVFVRELVPNRVVAGIARALYNEPYSAAPYAVERHAVGDGVSVSHLVRDGGKMHRFAFLAGGRPVLPPEDSLDHFLKEQEWGFGTTRGGQRAAYRVEHPAWRIYPETRFDLAVDCGVLYGERWAFLDRATPISRLVAEGSAVKVFARTLENETSK
jgi:uncharacterized protein YqjF (DUF2071 family)